MIRAALSLFAAAGFVMGGALWMVRGQDLERTMRALAPPRLRTVELEELLPRSAPLQETKPERVEAEMPEVPEPERTELAAPEVPKPDGVEAAGLEASESDRAEAAAFETPEPEEAEAAALEAPDSDPVPAAAADRDAVSSPPPRDQDQWAELIRRMLALYRRGGGTP